MDNLANKNSPGIQKNSKTLISSQLITKYGANCPSFLVASATDSDAEDVIGKGSSKVDLTPDADEEDSPTSKKTRWLWSSEMCERLIHCLHEYKIKTNLEGRDMESDLVRMYEDLRREMATIYPMDCFGPVSVDNCQLDSRNIEKERKKMKLGYVRVKDKVKKIRCNFKRALLGSSRVEGGRIIAENWDPLLVIWGGCPAVSKIGGAVSSQSNGSTAKNVNGEESDAEVLETPKNQEDVTTEELNESAYPKKRPLSVEPVSGSGKEYQTRNSIEIKRAKLEKPLSALQRDEVMVHVAKDELDLKKRTLEVLQQSSQNMVQMVGAMTQSMTVLGKQLENGFALLAKALATDSANKHDHSQRHQHVPPQQHHLGNMLPNISKMPHSLPNSKVITTNTAAATAITECISRFKAKHADERKYDSLGCS